MMETKKLVTVEVPEKLSEIIIQYARETGMTISNILDCMNLVEKHMKCNAVLEKENPDMPITLYLCDGKKECAVKEGCHLNGGKCMRTQDINHALNFQRTYRGNFKEKGILGHTEKSI